MNDLISRAAAIAAMKEECWKDREMKLSDRIERRLAALPAASQSEAEPVVWVIPGDDTEDCNGFIDAMAWEEGEFTRPLYAHPTHAPVEEANHE